MKWFISIIIFVGFIQFSTQDINNRIVNGILVNDIRQFSYQAVLRNKNEEHICGAVILNKNHLLTSAQCVFAKSPKNFEVMAGSKSLKSPSKTAEIMKVEEITIHPKYSVLNRTNDLAVIKIKKSFKFNDEISRINIQNATKSNVLPTKCVISGWGSQNTNAPLSDVLRYANVTPISFKECKSRSPSNIFEGMMCVFDKGTRTCYGDSGGPLVCGNKSLMGIMSFGFGCANNLMPDVYTNVTHYYDWIKTHSNSSVLFLSSTTFNILIVFLYSLLFY